MKIRLNSIALAISLLACAASTFAATFTVTTVVDEFDTPSGASLSLREAIRDAGTSPGADTIVFDASLSGATITLTGGVPIDGDAAGMTIDASALPAGIIFHGNNSGRVVSNGGILTLRAITLTGGSLAACCGGAAVYNFGTITLERCTLSGNTAGFGGGAVFNDGAATLSRCTISGNYGGLGGALYNRNGSMTLAQCTIAGNQGNTDYSIYNDGTLSLRHCTVSGNVSVGNYGGMYNAAGRTFTIENSIIGGNSGLTDLHNGGTLVRVGANVSQALPQNFGSGSITGGGSIINAAPQLGALANNGGPTQTLRPALGSPAIDAAVGSTETIDQRGFSRSDTSVPDIGAVETGTPDLTLLTLSSGLLEPTGTPYFYKTTVSNNVTSIIVTCVTAHPLTTLTVNGVAVASGSPSANIALALGNNVIVIIATSEIGATQTHTITVTRSIVVTSNALSGVGSIRQAILDAAASPGADTIRFASALSGQTIALTNGPLALNDTNSVTIDGSDLPEAVTLAGNGTDRIIVNSGILTVRVLTLTGGFCNHESGGGAVLNSGTLTLERCTISGSAGGYGSAIFNTGTMTLRQCTVSGNVAHVRAAIENRGNMTVSHCTVVGNSGGSLMPGLNLFRYYYNPLDKFYSCDISGSNGDFYTIYYTAGIYNSMSGSLVLDSTIVVNDSQATQFREGLFKINVATFGTFSALGLNIVRYPIFEAPAIPPGYCPMSESFPPSFRVSNYLGDVEPQLMPLGKFGGPVPTMLPRPGSPAIDSAAGSTNLVDQRGFVRPADGDRNGSAVADVGAVEFQPSDRTLLQALTISTGALSPSFNPQTLNYAVSVPYDVGQVTVTPVALDAASTIVVNGVNVTSGTASGNIPLNLGTNVLTVIVTSIDNVVKTYTITVTRLPSANLASLVLSAGTLSPVFNKATTSYTAAVPYLTSSIAVTPTAEQPGSTITVNGVAVASGSPSAGIPLNVGTNFIQIAVTSPGGETNRTYNVTVRRLPGLTNLELSVGALMPAFNSTVTRYLVSVPVDTTSIVVRPTSPFSISVNGVPVASGADSQTISLNPGANTITIIVTAPDGVTTETYTLTVRRPVIVTTTANSGVGSLRAALLAMPDTILFDTNLSGQTITLTSGSLQVNDTNGVTIDASALTGGLIINGNGADRIFVNNGTLTLRALGLTGGLTGSVNGGGGVLNYGFLTMERCNLSQNAGGYGGAIWNNAGATMILRHCTIAGNTSTTESGGVANRGTLTLTHCTVAGNSSPLVGGVYNFNGSLTIDNSIVAGNSGSNGADINSSGVLTVNGANIVQASIQNSGTTESFGTVVNADPQLLPLAYYGGPTRTMLPRNGSPVIDAAAGSTATIDQRGNVRPVDGDQNGSAVADIGAVEVVGGDATLLQNLALSTGTISPDLNTGNGAYATTVPNEVSNLTVTATAAQTNATITVNGSPVVSGAPSSNIPLSVGTNTITTVVTAGDGITTRTYVINVTRLSNTYLASLAVSAGALSPAFVRSTTNYSNLVPNETTSISFTPTVEEASSSITVNGSPVASGSSVTFPVNEGASTITIVVSNQDGVTARTYTVNLYRAFVVTTTANSGAGSLIQVMLDVAAIPGPDIINFHPSLSGQTINVGELIGLTTDAGTLTLDASALPGGLILNGTSAGLFVNQATLTVRGITFTGGIQPLSVSTFGGGMLNEGTLVLERCTFNGNRAEQGGAIYNSISATATIRECSFATNVAGYGGAIFNAGTMTIERCGFLGNSIPLSSDYRGGAVFTEGNAHTTLRQCTVFSGGHPPGAAGPVAALYNERFGHTAIIHCTFHGTDSSSGIRNKGELTVENSIVSTFSPSIEHQGGTITLTGRNIIDQIFGGFPLTGADTIIPVNLPLQPMGNYGGPTMTMPPLEGSLAIDTAIGSTETIDQRGFLCPVDGDGNGTAAADIGALEFVPTILSIQPMSQTVVSGTNVQFTVTASGNAPTYQWFFNSNSIPGANASTLNLTNVSRAQAGYYSVTVTNYESSAISSNALLHILISQKIQSLLQDGNGRWTLKFNDADGGLLTTDDLAHFEIQASTNLVQWTILTNALTLTNGVLHFTEPNASTAPARFFRVRSK